MKRVVKIVLPFAAVFLFYLREAAFSFGAFITMGPHLWPIYALPALYLLVPFLPPDAGENASNGGKLFAGDCGGVGAYGTACTHFHSEWGFHSILVGIVPGDITNKRGF